MRTIKLTGLLTIILSVLLFSSCDLDDGFPSDEFKVNLATVHPLDGNAYYLVLDNGSKLWVAATDYPNFKPRENQRAMIDYTILSGQTGEYDHYVKINYIKESLTKDVIDLTAENQDSIGHDPIKILSMWVGDNFLNIRFGYNTGNAAIHYVNLVNNTLENNQPGDKIPLEFRHNKNGDSEKYGTTGYVSFDLKPYRDQNQDSIRFVIKIKDFSEDKQYNVTYKFNGEVVKISHQLDTNFDATKYK